MNCDHRIREIEGTPLDWLSNPSFDGKVPTNEEVVKNDKSEVSPNERRAQEEVLTQYFSDDTDGSNSEEDTVGGKASVKKDHLPRKESSEESLVDMRIPKSHKSSKSKSKRKKSRDRSSSHHHKKKKRQTYYSSEDSVTDAEDHRKSPKHHKKKKKKKERSKEEKSSRRKHRDKAKKDSLDVLPILPNKVFIEDVYKLTPEHAFRIDRGKDVNNLACGSIFSEHLARRYRLVNCSLGQHKGQNVWVNEKSQDKKEEKPRYYYKHFVKQSKQIGRKCIKISDESNTNSFIPIRESHKGSKEDNTASISKIVNPLGIYDSGTELWLQGKGTTQGDETEINIDHESANQLKMADYNKRLNDYPQDIDLWLEFAKFQEKENNFTKVERNIKDVDENRPLRASIVEIKMAVIHKALEKNPNCIRLKLAQLEFGKDIWDADELLKEWNNLLFQHANSAPLWIKYLEFRQSLSVRFTVTGVLKAFEKAIKTLVGITMGEMKSHTALPHTEYFLLYIFSEVCHLLSEAGHQEKATAMYQAMIEYNLFFPDVLKDAGTSDTKDFFEAFWEGSIPRIGEDQAQGWNTWVETKGSADNVVPWSNRDADDQLEENLLKKTSCNSDGWFGVETIRNMRHWLPWRPNVNLGETDDDCEDPDRQVLADDVTSCLFKLNTEKDNFLLICHFLQSLGVKIEVLLTEFNGNVNISWSDEIFTKVACGKHTLFKQTQSVFENFDNIDKFVCNIFDQVIPQFSSEYKVILTRAYLDFKTEKCFQGGPSSKDYKNLKKWSKSLLKVEENRNSLLLWEAFANMEWKFGHKVDAIKVIEVTLCSENHGIAKNMKDKSMQNDVCRMYRKCVELHLGINCNENNTGISDAEQVNSSNMTNRNTVVNTLFSLATGDKFSMSNDQADANHSKMLSVSKIMKGKRLFMENTHTLIEKFQNSKDSINDSEVILFSYSGSFLVHWLVCSAYFVYLTETFEAATEIFTSALQKIKPVSTDYSQPEQSFNPSLQYIYRQYRELYTCFIRLCKYHVDTVPTAPMKLLRDPLYVALEDLPTDTDFLDLYVEVESHASIAGRVRQFFRQVAPEIGSSTVWMYAILAELTRRQKLDEYNVQNQLCSAGQIPIKESGLTHQLRAWFERAVSHPVAGKTVLLWRLYALFEVEQKCIVQAKAIFYRALQQCPGAKALYMDMAHSLPDHLSEVTDLMMERELRLRTPLEELKLLLSESFDITKTDAVNIDDTAISVEETEQNK